MNRVIATIKINQKITSQLSSVRHQLITSSETISMFSGYLEALKDVQAITEDEASAYMREYVKALIEL